MFRWSTAKRHVTPNGVSLSSHCAFYKHATTMWLEPKPPSPLAVQNNPWTSARCDFRTAFENLSKILEQDDGIVKKKVQDALENSS